MISLSVRIVNQRLGDLIKDGNIEQVQNHIQQNPHDLECIAGRFKVTPFLRAAIHGQTQIGKFLAQQGCNIYQCDVDGYNAALLASQYGHLEFLQFLAQLDPQILKVKLPDLQSSIHLAISYENYELAQFLQQYIDLRNCQCDYASDLLEFCVRFQKFKYIQNLVKDFQLPYDYRFVGNLQIYLDEFQLKDKSYQEIVKFLVLNKMWRDRRYMLFVRKHFKSLQFNQNTFPSNFILFPPRIINVNNLRYQSLSI